MSETEFENDPAVQYVETITDLVDFYVTELQAAAEVFGLTPLETAAIMLGATHSLLDDILKGWAPLLHNKILDVVDNWVEEFRRATSTGSEDVGNITHG